MLAAEDLDLLTSIATTYQPAQTLAGLVQDAFDAGRLQLLGVANGQMVPSDEIVARCGAPRRARYAGAACRRGAVLGIRDHLSP